MPITTQSANLSPNIYDDLPVPHPLSRMTLIRGEHRRCCPCSSSCPPPPRVVIFVDRLRSEKHVIKSNAYSNANTLCSAMGFDFQYLGNVIICFRISVRNAADSVGGHISSSMVCRVVMSCGSPGTISHPRPPLLLILILPLLLLLLNCPSSTTAFDGTSRDSADTAVETGLARRRGEMSSSP